MDIFLDTTTALENAAKLMVEANARYGSIVDRLAAVEDLLMTSGASDDLTVRVDALEKSLEDAALNYADSTSILDMITSVNSRLNQVINGQIPTEIQYNTDVLGGGDGMTVDKSVPDSIKLVNTNYGYTLNDVFEYDFIALTVGNLIDASNLFNMTLSASSGLLTRIRPYDNLVRIHTDLGALSGDLNIYLDDSINAWKKGQTIKISFKSELPILGTNKINIYTDKQNTWVLKASLDTSNLLSQKPYVELICIDQTNKTFELEIIR